MLLLVCWTYLSGIIPAFLIYGDVYKSILIYIINNTDIEKNVDKNDVHLICSVTTICILIGWPVFLIIYISTIIFSILINLKTKFVDISCRISAILNTIIHLPKNNPVDVKNSFKIINYNFNLFKHETEDILNLYIELPGLSKEDVSIQLIHRKIIVKLKNNYKEDSHIYLALNEKHDFSKDIQIEIEDKYDPDTAVIELKNGLLNIELYKNEKYEPKQLTIN